MSVGEGNEAYGRKAFKRSRSHFADRITADGRDGWPVEAGRYRLVVSRACPWASRAVISRRLLGLEDALSMAVTDPVQDDHIKRHHYQVHIKRHHYQVHTGIRPTGIVPLGPGPRSVRPAHTPRPRGAGRQPVRRGDISGAGARRRGRGAQGSSLSRRHRNMKEADQMSKKKKKLPLAYQPLGFALGWLSGALASAAFRKTWKVIRHEDDAPDALDRDRGWGEVLLAAAVQGAIFAVARSAVDRMGAKAIERSTGVWPATEKGGRD